MKYLPPTFATKNIVIKTSSEEKMNRLLFGMMLLAVGCLAGSCTDDDEYTQGVWMRRLHGDKPVVSPSIIKAICAAVSVGQTRHT